MELRATPVIILSSDVADYAPRPLRRRFASSFGSRLTMRPSSRLSRGTANAARADRGAASGRRRDRGRHTRTRISSDPSPHRLPGG
jgi:hypothetical protein